VPLEEGAFASEWRELKERICMRPNLTHTLNPGSSLFFVDNQFLGAELGLTFGGSNAFVSHLSQFNRLFVSVLSIHNLSSQSVFLLGGHRCFWLDYERGFAACGVVSFRSKYQLDLFYNIVCRAS
jgi:hypothetical protein